MGILCNSMVHLFSCLFLVKLGFLLVQHTCHKCRRLCRIGVAMSKSVQVEVDTKKLNEILKKLPGNRDKAIRAIAFSIERKAKINAPVDTGALRASIYVRTPQGNYSSRQEMSGLPEVQGEPVRETLPPVKEGEAVIGPSVEYGLHVEFGTRRQRAQPYLGPAVNSTFKELEEHLKGVCTNGE